ncbi:hypothetical protein GCM10016272_01450 [Psychrobacter glaciei]|uniref:Uncharacterized protein n=1 Tax=Psychrobacter glaciei TaxID=619771 RepID=A0ABQ3GMC3_9GAMM|nr:hypothetical protein [Psychrobacter glaciei]GHD25534.1 hypothetical protein GCM10016272_01450 [Psychrobacter glaciei]
MSRSTLNVRIPEDKHKYLRLKATHSGKQLQELVTECIDQYQQSDEDYMSKFKPLIESPNTKENAHGA